MASEQPTNPNPMWMEEPDHMGDSYRMMLKMDKVIFEGQTEFQKMVVFDNPMYGRCLALDNFCQTTEKDEFMYHEMLCHVPMFAHGAAERVLIVGGGDGGALEEVLKHDCVKHVSMVEIDGAVVDWCKNHIPSICKRAFEDKRLNLVIEDGTTFVARQKDDSFDVIIVDSTDPVGAGVVLFEEAFYTQCNRILAPGGVYVQQSANPFIEHVWLKKALSSMHASGFSDTSCYLTSVPSYYGGHMAIMWASEDENLRNVPAKTLKERLDKHPNILADCKYYTPDIHKAAFIIPPYILKMLPETASVSASLFQ